MHRRNSSFSNKVLDSWCFALHFVKKLVFCFLFQVCPLSNYVTVYAEVLVFGQSVVAVQSETLSFCQMFIVEMWFGFVF